MKRILLFVIAVFSTVAIVYAQSPEAFKYQAVARGTSGQPLTNQSVSLQISILQTSASGTIVYTETHAATTNDFGLFALNIGEGTVVTGDFSTIDWGADNYFIQIEMDETGGTSYNLMGTSQLLSVPYALHAESANNVINDQVDDADADTTNELQTLSLSGNDLTISDGNTVTLSSGGSSLWTENGSDIYYNTGNVGIGTNTPASKLTIANGSIQVYNGWGIRFGGMSTVIYGASGISNLIHFCINSTPQLSINEDGNIGIGTTSPDTKLDINSNTIRIRTADTPASNADGYTGEIRWDANFIYVCTNGDGPGGSVDTWKRSPLTGGY